MPPRDDSDPALRRPVFVVGADGPACERLARSLLAAPGTWQADGALGDGGRLTADDAPGSGPAVRADLVRRHRALAPVPEAAAPPRLVGAHPTAAGQVPFLAAVFPDARFVLVHRDPAQSLAGQGEVAEAAERWGTATRTLLDDLRRLPRDRWTSVDWADLVAEPDNEVQRVCSFLDLGWHSGCSRPWHEAAGAPAQEGIAPGPAVAALADLVREVRSTLTPAAPSLGAATPAGSLSAVDRGLGAVLRSLGSSLMVSTYQTNRVVVLREQAGTLGVHLRAFDRPMGIARTPHGIALGLRSEVLDLRNFAAVAHQLEPAGRHDACFMPRNSHVTGDIAVHDLGLGRDGMWVVATAFSCLATLDIDHSFVPRWRPPFVSALAPEDRCHLNGLALVDGVPAFVTALGVSDTAGGWRPGKAEGGVVLRVPSGEVVVDGLSMPHSPRWHQGRLYVLESGRGRLIVCDPETGATETVVELPGFTRGLSFQGDIAFVGTSQVRETATFGGLPVAELPARECGVWAIDLRSGRVVGSVLFQDRIQELFDVAVLPGVRFPEVVEPGSDLVHSSWFVPAGPDEQAPAG